MTRTSASTIGQLVSPPIADAVAEVSAGLAEHGQAVHRPRVPSAVRFRSSRRARPLPRQLRRYLLSTFTLDPGDDARLLPSVAPSPGLDIFGFLVRHQDNATWTYGRLFAYPLIRRAAMRTRKILDDDRIGRAVLGCSLWNAWNGHPLFTQFLPGGAQDPHRTGTTSGFGSGLRRNHFADLLDDLAIATMSASPRDAPCYDHAIALMVAIETRCSGADAVAPALTLLALAHPGAAARAAAITDPFARL